MVLAAVGIAGSEVPFFAQGSVVLALPAQVSSIQASAASALRVPASVEVSAAAASAVVFAAGEVEDSVTKLGLAGTP